MKVLGNYLLVKIQKLEAKKETESGLLLNAKSREDIRFLQAEVISSAVDFLKKGDQIYCDKHAGHKIELKGIEYQVIKVGDVVLVL